MLRLVVPHFLARCPVCRERHAEILRLQKEVGHWDPEIAVIEGRQAPELWARLAGRPYAEQLREVEQSEDLHAWGLCQLLLQKSREATFSDPARGVELANLALRVVRHLGKAYDPNWVMDLRARCFAHLGNARRVLGELRSAEDAFVKAETAWPGAPPGNVEARAEILDLKSSLRRAQRTARRGAGSGRPSALPVSRGRRGRTGSRSRCSSGPRSWRRAEISSGAIDLLRRTRSEIDPVREPRLLVYGRFNLLIALLLGEDYRGGGAPPAGRRHPPPRSGQPLDLVRLRWVEGNVDLGLGRLGPAEAAFREVQREFSGAPHGL